MVEKGGWLPGASLQQLEREACAEMYENAAMLATEDGAVNVLAGATLGGAWGTSASGLGYRFKAFAAALLMQMAVRYGTGVHARLSLRKVPLAIEEASPAACLPNHDDARHQITHACASQFVTAGGTKVNWAAALRTPVHVKREWADCCGLPHFAGPRFEAALDAVCGRMGVTNDYRHNAPNALLKAGLQALGCQVRRACLVRRE